MRSHGRFVATGLVALFAGFAPTAASAGVFGDNFWNPERREPRPGEHLGEYVLADLLPPRSPLCEWTPPQMALPPGYMFDRGTRGSLRREYPPQPPQPPKPGDLPPKPGECLGDYALAGELPPYGPAAVAKLAAPTAPWSALSRVAILFEHPLLGPPAVVIEPAPPPRPVKAGRTWLPFAGPDEMQIAFEKADGSFEEPVNAFEAAQWLCLRQGQTHRFRLTGLVAGKPAQALVTTVEVANPTPATKMYVHYAAVVVTFRAEEAAQVGKRPVVKVMYLPHPSERSDAATVAGPEEVVSTSLKAGPDPVVEAKRLGTVLAVIRLTEVSE